MLVAVWLSGGLACTLDTSLKHRCQTSADCLSGRVCVRSVCQAPSNTSPHPNVMFVTSKKYPTRFQPLEAADDKCNAAAEAGGLSGDYRAWLSTAATYARDRLAGARGWVRTDGVPFADTPDDIAAGRIMSPPMFDEFGRRVYLSVEAGQELVATGTNEFGLNDPGQNCHDWANDDATSLTAGTTSGTAGVWTKAAAAPCGVPMRIYCFGVDQTYALVPPSIEGKRAFLSEKTFMQTDRLAAADATCAEDAAAVGLSGTFLALLSTSATPAGARFAGATPATWFRLDGVALNSPGADLFHQDVLLAPLNVTARGDYVSYDAALTGSAMPLSIGELAYDCNDWTFNQAAETGELGVAGNIVRVDLWFDEQLLSCDGPRRVY